MTAGIQADVWDRMLSPAFEGMSAAAARATLSVEFAAADVERYEHLRSRRASVELTPAERDELEVAVQLGSLLTLLHAKARAASARPPASGGSRRDEP